MGYTPSFTPQYENGWEDLPSETSPITAEALNAYDDAIENIENYLASDESQANLADAYDETETYAVGDYVIYSGDLYKCTTAISTAEEWDSTHWTPCLITDEMGHGGGGSNVSITPTLSTGTKIADFEIDGQTGELYAPTGGGGNANIWTGTQAELEEVFDELEEGTQINITDDEQEVVEGGTIYSEDEQVIGLWTDNRPLYQLTLVTASDVTVTTSGSWVSSGLTAPSGAQVIKCELVNDYLIGIIGVYINSSTGAISFSNIPKTGNITIPSGTKVTIQYTKSTDAPLDAVVGKKTMYIASSDCYSIEEKEVGCWTDGKPLYQRTLTIDTIASTIGVQRFAHNIANIETAFAISGTWLQKSDDSVYIGTKDIIRTDGSGNINVGKGSVGVWVDATNIIIDTTENRSSQYLVVTIRYTKTTDTAGSGSYTPASGKAVHYSTDEQVIGTWIDGKTLYRIVKEIAFSSLSTDGEQKIYDYRNDFPNCDIKKISGYSISATYGICNLGARSYKQNTQNGTYYEFSQYYGFPALRSSQGLSDINTNIKADLVLTFEYTKTD